jgi:hypothetical protein
LNVIAGTLWSNAIQALNSSIPPDERSIPLPMHQDVHSSVPFAENCVRCCYLVPKRKLRVSLAIVSLDPLSFKHRFSIKCQERMAKMKVVVKAAAIIPATDIPGTIAAIDCCTGNA